MESNAFCVRFTFIWWSSFPPSLPPSLGFKEQAAATPLIETGHELVLLLSLLGEMGGESGKVSSNGGVRGSEGGGGEGGREGGEEGLELEGGGGEAEGAVEEVGVFLVL